MNTAIFVIGPLKTMVTLRPTPPFQVCLTTFVMPAPCIWGLSMWRGEFSDAGEPKKDNAWSRHTRILHPTGRGMEEKIEREKDDKGVYMSRARRAECPGRGSPKASVRAASRNGKA